VWAALFKAQILSRAEPGQTKVVPAKAAMQAPNTKKTPIAIMAWREAGRSLA
jgi:hypothetical protein